MSCDAFSLSSRKHRVVMCWASGTSYLGCVWRRLLPLVCVQCVYDRRGGGGGKLFNLAHFYHFYYFYYFYYSNDFW